MNRENISLRRLTMSKLDPNILQRHSLVNALALKYGEDVEYIGNLVTFFSGSFFGLPTDVQKERVEQHLKNKADEQYRQRVSRNWNSNLILATGRGNTNG